MPPFFGGDEFNADLEARVNDVTGLNFTQTTDGDRLADYLPEVFEMLRPEFTISYNQFREVEFMAGGSYNLVQIGVPVRFTGKRDRLEGTLALVIWENKTQPIIGGREEDGMPKIHADIEDLHSLQQKHFTNVSHEGNTFLRLEMIGAQPVSEQQLEHIKAASLNFNAFGWRYIPKVGAPGAELNQPILYPQGMNISSVWTGRGTAQWTKLSYEQNPFQWKIINALAELPVKATNPVMMIKGGIIMKPFAGHVLE
jgi:Acetoacetate decarboxylase (ADC)